jgi:DNA mismatch repair ATPase MutS
LGIAISLSGRRSKLKELIQIQEDWGSPQITRERDLETARLLFNSIPADDNRFVDEQTWKDLNMDRLYARIDRTYTDPGEAVLYRILREPLFDREELAQRNRIIRSIQTDRELREKVQIPLLRIGHQRAHNDLFNLFWRKDFPKTRIRLVYSAMALAALLSIFVPILFWNAILVLIPVGIFAANGAIHYFTKRQKDLETMSFPYLIKFIRTAKELSFLSHEAIKQDTGRLDELYRSSQKILGKARFLFPAGQGFGDIVEILYEYFNIFFLLEIRAFYSTVDELSRHLPELQEMYLIMGRLDALQSVASYRASLTDCTDPVFEANGIHLKIQDAYQPLLDKPVPTSLSVGKNVIVIIGSNMGGKSTFLRTIGNSVLMAQTIATVPASYYQGSFFRIVTSISRTDDLIAGKSYYYVEAERILRTIKSFGEGVPTLCIIDELLSGTNSNERLLASEAIVRYMAMQNTLAIIATHDIELTERLNGTCDFYYFTGSVDENGLKFDYLIKPGIAKTGNAIALLEYLGYPEEITQEVGRKDNNPE